MSQATLELVISVKSMEPALRALKGELSSSGDAEKSVLGSELATLIKERLVAAGLPADAQVECHCGQLKTRHNVGGGLNAQEWMDGKP